MDQTQRKSRADMLARAYLDAGYHATGSDAPPLLAAVVRYASIPPMMGAKDYPDHDTYRAARNRSGKLWAMVTQQLPLCVIQGVTNEDMARAITEEGTLEVLRNARGEAVSVSVGPAPGLNYREDVFKLLVAACSIARDRRAGEQP